METLNAEDPVPDHCRKRLVTVAHYDFEMGKSPRSYDSHRLLDR